MKLTLNQETTIEVEFKKTELVIVLEENDRKSRATIIGGPYTSKVDGSILYHVECYDGRKGIFNVDQIRKTERSGA